MQIHAILGATGGTGAAVLRSLLGSPHPLTLHIYIRSPTKLHQLFPYLHSHHSHTIKTFPTSEDDALLAALRDAQVIYNCIGTNEITRGNDLDVSTAESVVAALHRIRIESRADYRAPLVLWNRTVALNDAIANPIPTFLEPVFRWTLDWVLDDMRAAGEIYRQAASTGLLGYVFVDPPKIVDPLGVERTGYEVVRAGRASLAINYADLGAAFVEIAERGEEFRDRAVGVLATGKVRMVWWEVLAGFLWAILCGLRGKMMGM